MAKKNRVDLNAVIQANLPDNTIDFITPALDREVEIDEVDSCFNLEDDTAVDVNYAPTTPADWDVVPTEVAGGLDELAGRVETIENEPNQTAFQTPYTPTIPADWGAIVPAEVRGSLDILIKKVSTNSSTTVAYVATNGSDVVNEFELGNPLKPFATIQAAVDAVPNNGKVIVSPGTYSELSGAVFINNRFLSIIMDGVTFNGNIIAISGVAGIKYISLRGATINGIFRWENGISYGGTVNGSIKIDFSSIYNIIVNHVSIPTAPSSTDAIFGAGYNLYDSEITANFGRCIEDGSSIRVYNCKLTGLFCLDSSNIVTNATVPRFYDCDLISESNTINGANGASNCIMYNCNITSTTTTNIGLRRTSTIVYFKNCNFKAELDNVTITNDDIQRTVNEQTTLDNCTFWSNTGSPLKEPALYTVDLGTTLFLNCTINKASITSVAPLRVTENNTYSLLALQDFT